MPDIFSASCISNFYFCTTYILELIQENAVLNFSYRYRAALKKETKNTHLELFTYVVFFFNVFLTSKTTQTIFKVSQITFLQYSVDNKAPLLPFPNNKFSLEMFRVLYL